MKNHVKSITLIMVVALVMSNLVGGSKIESPFETQKHETNQPNAGVLSSISNLLIETSVDTSTVVVEKTNINMVSSGNLEDVEDISETEKEEIVEEYNTEYDNNNDSHSDITYSDSNLKTKNINKNEIYENISKEAYRERTNIDEFTDCDMYLYASASVNIRQGEGENTNKIGEFQINDTVHVVGQKENSVWVRVDYNGQVGYVHSEYLSTEKQKEKYLGRFELTGYCPCSKCCGKTDGITASGARATAGRTVAMYGIPFGTKVKIGDHIYTVEDRGTPYGHFDIYFNTHSEAAHFAVQYADVYVILED